MKGAVVVAETVWIVVKTRADGTLLKPKTVVSVYKTQSEASLAFSNTVKSVKNFYRNCFETYYGRPHYPKFFTFRPLDPSHFYWEETENSFSLYDADDRGSHYVHITLEERAIASVKYTLNDVPFDYPHTNATVLYEDEINRGE